MAAEYKKQIIELLESVDDANIIFLRQILIMIKVHLHRLDGFLKGIRDG